MTRPDSRALRDAFGRFATGVTVITTREADGTPRGLTANSFSSVSLEPPLVLVCISHHVHSYAAFCAAPHFAVNILGSDQRALSDLFASRAADKFERAEWHEGSEGVPLLPGSLGTLICARRNLVDAGDHVILIGEVLECAAREGAGLGYFQSRYVSIGADDQ